jgi:hypothetical protein
LNVEISGKLLFLEQIKLPPVSQDSQNLPLPSVIPAEYIHATGNLRLAVIGWTNPSNPEGSKIAAYTDIEIR